MKKFARSIRQIILSAFCLCVFATTSFAGFLYVERDSIQGNQIYGFAVNETTGALTPLSGFPILTAGHGKENGQSEFLTIDAANGRLYVLNDIDRSVSAYSINPATGALTPLPFHNFALPFRDWATIAVHPSGSPLTIGEQGLSSVTGVASYIITPTTATAAAGSPFTTASGARLFASVYSRDGQYYYGGGNTLSLVAGLSVNGASGTLTPLPGSPYNVGAGYPAAYATDSAGRLYLTHYSFPQSSVFTTTNGVLSPVNANPFFNGGLTTVSDGVLHPNENFYAISNRTPASAGILRITGTGANTMLTPVEGSPLSTGGTYANALVFNQSGNFLFVANGSSRNITSFSVHPTTGAMANIAIQPANTLGTSGRLNGIGYYSAPAARRSQFDYDGDGKADVSVFRPSDNVWYMLNSSSGFSATHFGLASDKITPADFDGDGRAEIAVFRNNVWYWLNSSNGAFNSRSFGQAGDIPLPADYTGDGRAELAVYRAGTWVTLNLVNNQSNSVQFGLASDKPVPADYDGDGKTDMAVYRDGVWYLLGSTGGSTAVQFGLATDRPVVGDYDGDGKADPAVFRDGLWYVLGSTQGFFGVQFGIASDVPVPADYDGDGKTDVAVYRDGVWYQLGSTQGFKAVQFGTGSDLPVPAAYLP